MLGYSRAGLSPPTRGNLHIGMWITQMIRSIPAHAGEPGSPDGRARMRRVYPRPRGGTGRRAVSARHGRGLSPPTRGNRAPCRTDGGRKRSIPAHAGEPTGRRGRTTSRGVYPRPRGGTWSGAATGWISRGLSPPTRGNLIETYQHETSLRSIPAHAGEPAGIAVGGLVVGVYPRPRGGTDMRAGTTATATGLSPPTRGNHRCKKSPEECKRSIPAHAGEPARPASRIPRVRVYPRPRGGTLERILRKRIFEGLSPPTRGNPGRAGRQPDRAGSIPAHAGEPRARCAGAPASKVYPRPRGGTGGRRRFSRRSWGLSPPTRGNPRQADRRGVRVGSIPAHAGEPVDLQSSQPTHRVYPRPRGGTRAVRPRVGDAHGLSPPTRGNLSPLPIIL